MSACCTFIEDVLVVHAILRSLAVFVSPVSMKEVNIQRRWLSCKTPELGISLAVVI
jgi:hypothetical protein